MLCGNSYSAPDEVADRPCDACVQKTLSGCTPIARRHARKAVARVSVVLIGLWTCMEVIRAGWEGRDAALALSVAGSLAFYAAVSLTELLSGAPPQAGLARIAHPRGTAARLRRALGVFTRNR